MGGPCHSHYQLIGFKRLSHEEIDKLTLAEMNDDAEYGYIYEVDLRYPHHLHGLHNDHPFAPERFAIDKSMLSPLQKTFPKHKKKTTTKLTPNLKDKTNYVVHHRNLQFYIEQGMGITKVHRVLTFKQSPWLKEYIDYNTQKRASSTSTFDKDFFKPMNNSVFGKTQENLRNWVNVEVITKRNVALK